ncbi:MAG: hypothetical protein CVU05_02665 [Bacteroidetes bacterium HGW-Bacteroidetes-21]|jgi:integrase|nr:MAG: hypothetical protein CVU05_02665 [Bacteroidetes bacterium HGW-Bacteroidetes-21]
MKQYKFAKLYDKNNDIAKRWFVGYYFIHPETLKYQLFKVWISSCLRTRQARIKKANELISNINIKLTNGYNPYENENISFTNLIEALETVLKYKETYIRKRSFHTYRSCVHLFTEWLKAENHDKMVVEAFNFQDAIKYADYLKVNKKLSNRTFNNYIDHLRIMFNELVKREYLLKNPFRNIDRLPDGERTIFAYSENELTLLKNHFPENAPKLWLICQFIYYCAIRPGELVQIKIKYIDLKNKTINIPAFVSKNKRQNIVNVPDPLSIELNNLSLNNFNPEYYLFSKELEPGDIKIAPTRLSEKFRVEANKIGLTRKLYELKHTGAGKSLEAGADIRDLQLHLRHTNINTTEVYLRAFKSATSKEFIRKFPKL